MKDLLSSRQDEYGIFFFQAFIAQRLKDTLKLGSGWTRTACDQREALDMIANKLSRISNGNPNNIDSWVDIAGYATRIAERLQDEMGEAKVESKSLRRIRKQRARVPHGEGVLRNGRKGVRGDSPNASRRKVTARS